MLENFVRNEIVSEGYRVSCYPSTQQDMKDGKFQEGEVQCVTKR